MSQNQGAINPVVGYRSQPERIFMTSVNAVTRGDVGVVDELTAGSVTSDGVPYKVKQPATAELVHGIFCVAAEDIGAGKNGYWYVRGQCDVLVAGAHAVGVALGGANGVDNAVAVAATTKCFAKVRVASGGAGLTLCDIDGRAGFSNNA